MNVVTLLEYSIGGTMILMFFLFNKMTSGLIVNLMKVNARPKKKVLVKVYNLISAYYTTGEYEQGILKIKSRFKDEKSKEYPIYTLAVPEDKPELIKMVFKKQCFEVYEEKGGFKLVNDSEHLRALTGYDAQKFDYLLQRALMRPALDDVEMLKKMIIFTLLGVGAVALITLYLAFQINAMKKEIGMIHEILIMVANNTAPVPTVI